MNEQQRKSWEQMRSQGIGRYIFETGILRFALPVWILTDVIMYALQYNLASSDIERLVVGQKNYYHLVAMLIGGVFFALMTWVLAEKKYQKLNS